MTKIPKPNCVSNLLSIGIVQFNQITFQATQEADFYMHIYFNAFKQTSALRSCHEARKNKTEIVKLYGIVLVLGLY
jgi:hypothetical protein